MVPWVCGRYQRRFCLKRRSVRMWKVFLVTPTSLTALSRTSRKNTPTPTTAKCAHWPSTTAIRSAAVYDSCGCTDSLCVIHLTVFPIPLSSLSFIHQELGAVSLDGYFHLWKAEDNLCKVQLPLSAFSLSHILAFYAKLCIFYNCLMTVFSV